MIEKDNLVIKANEILELLLKKKIIDYLVFEKGVDHLVWKVNFEDKSYVLKIGARTIVDKYVLNKLKSINYKSPRIITSYEVENKNCIVMEFVQGELISKKIGNYIEDIINELKILHSNFKYKLGGYTYDYLDGKLGKWTDFIFTLIDFPTKDINWDSILPEDYYGNVIINRTRKYLKEMFYIIKEPNEKSLLHFDINISNVIIEDQKIKSIIDWSDSRIGDPLYDFARFRLTLEHLGDENLIVEYYKYLNLNDYEKDIEKYYFFHICLEYVYHFYSIGNKKYVNKTLDLLKKIYE